VGGNRKKKNPSPKLGGKGEKGRGKKFTRQKPVERGGKEFKKKKKSGEGVTTRSSQEGKERGRRDTSLKDEGGRTGRRALMSRWEDSQMAGVVSSEGKERQGENNVREERGGSRRNKEKNG